MTSTTVCKNQERKLRRALMQEGYSLRKSRKPISVNNMGEYMIVDTINNCVVAGSNYELTLDDVAEWLNG